MLDQKGRLYRGKYPTVMWIVRQWKEDKYESDMVLDNFVSPFFRKELPVSECLITKQLLCQGEDCFQVKLRTRGGVCDGQESKS